MIITNPKSIYRAYITLLITSIAIHVVGLFSAFFISPHFGAPAVHEFINHMSEDLWPTFYLVLALIMVFIAFPIIIVGMFLRKAWSFPPFLGFTFFGLFADAIDGMSYTLGFDNALISLSQIVSGALIMLILCHGNTIFLKQTPTT